MSETTLQTARRLALEGRKRIKRQEKLLAELEKDGHPNMLRDASILLEDLQVSQRLFEARLATLARRR